MSFAKAQHHHGKLAAALKSGDMKTSMHHAGHIMAALKHAAKSASPQAKQQAAPSSVAKTAGQTSLRGRLSAMRTAPGTDAGSVNAAGADDGMAH